MMLPLLPINMVTEDILMAIVDDWKNVKTYNGDEFMFVVKYVMKTGIGRVKSDGNHQDAVFPPVLWNVFGQKIRTNNAAESVHSRLNKKAAGRISLFRFLGIIEEGMRRTVDKMTRGCGSATNPVERRKTLSLHKHLHISILVKTPFNSWTSALQYLNSETKSAHSIIKHIWRPS